MNQPTAVVTGAGALGSAVVKKFLEQKFKVFLLSKFNGQLPKVSNESLVYLDCDLTNQPEVVEAFAKIIKLAGRIDACVHTAIGAVVTKKILDMSSEEFISQFQVDLFGGFNVFKQAATVMAKQKFGCLVGVSSSYTEPGVQHPSLAGYVADKYALRGLLRELALELAPVGVRVNAVAPSFMAAGLNAKVPARMVEFIQEKNPMKQVVSPEDVANVVYFLCTDSARAITGVHLPVAFGEVTTL